MRLQIDPFYEEEKDMSDKSNLPEELLQAKFGRRQFVTRSVVVGLTLSSVGALLAACGGDDDEPAATTAATQAPSGGGASTATAAATEASGTTPPASGGTPAATSGGSAPAGELPADADEEQHLVIAGAKDIVSLDPVQSNDADSNYIIEQIHDTVALLDPEFNVLPNLAESWEASDDGLTYTYKFISGAMFHDGTEMTADDVIFTIDRILENKYPEGRKAEKIAMIEEYSKIDDQTVEITLEFPYGPFPAAFGNQMIVPKAVVEDVGDEEFARNPVGLGPFKFVEWRPNDHVSLVRHDDYWRQPVFLQEITVRPIPENAVAVANLLSKDVDVITDVVGSNLPQVKSADGVDLITKPGFSYFWAGFRMWEPPFTDVRFRQAVYYATDFDAAIAAIFPPELGTRAYGTVPPGLWPQDQEYLKSIALPQDQEKSKALFQELIDEGIMPEDYTITLAPPPDDARIKIAEVMATNLIEVGRKAEIVRVEWATYSDLTSEPRNMIFYLGTTPAIPDPDANVRWLFEQASSHGRYLNITQFEEYPEWEEQIFKAQQSADRAEREKIYTEIGRKMMELVVHIPLYNKNAILTKRDYVQDLDVNLLFTWNLVKPWATVYLSGK